jgi:KUP system potassium uptake protein
VLAAFNPVHGIHFFAAHGLHGYLVLGTVFLVVTGGEALYADMGHFGLRPIRVAWFGLVFVALLLNYLGQGALLLDDPTNRNPFYALAPRWAVIPLVGLATTATVIASQALISGVFSLTMQAVQLGYCPRLQIEHTSAYQYGQIFIGPINWALMLATIGLVIGFGSSSDLAAAYGVAVTGTMAITTILFAAVARQRWSWPKPLVALVAGSFLLVDLAFLGANLAKIPQGGWFPLAVAAFVFTLLSTWKRGRALVGERLRKSVRPLPVFMKAIDYDPPTRVPGTAVFMTGNPEGVPLALLHNLLHNKVLHRRVVMLSVQFEQIPHVPVEERVEVEERANGFHVVTASYGFMEEPDVPAILEACEALGLRVKPNETTFFLGRETLVPRPHKHGFALWRQRLFAFMARNAQPAVAYFRIPPHRVIEVGQQIEL